MDQHGRSPCSYDTNSFARDVAVPFEYEELEVDFKASRVTFRGSVLDLTPIEYRLLGGLIKHAGKIVSSRTLLGLVWGREYLEEARYLKVHIKHLRNKLREATDAPKYIFNERNVGYGFAMTDLPGS